MKKRIIALVLVCMTVVSLCACNNSGKQTTAAPAPAETTAAPVEVEPYCFNFSFGGNSGSSMVAIANLLMDELSKASNGAFTFNTYNDPGYKESQAFDELQNDLVDIVYLASGSVSTNITDVAYLGMPGCYRYTDDPTTFYDFEATIRDTMSDIYAAYGIHYLGLRVPSRMVIIGKGNPVKVPSDLNGQIVRVAGTWMGKLMVSLGIATATLGGSEIVTGLQRGTINACVTGIEQVKTNLIYEASDYCGVFPETDGIGALVMNESCWSQLTDAQKAAVETAVQNWMAGCLLVSSDFTQQSLDVMKEYNVNVYDITSEECDEWLVHLDEIYAEADQQATENGLKLKEQIIEWNKKQRSK